MISRESPDLRARGNDRFVLEISGSLVRRVRKVARQLRADKMRGEQRRKIAILYAWWIDRRNDIGAKWRGSDTGVSGVQHLD